MPTQTEMEEVTKLIESRQASTYSRRDGGIIETIDGDLGWRDLSDLEQRAILEFNVTWRGFTPEQALDVIGNVLTGDSPGDWMNGVLIEHQAKEFDGMRELEAMFRDIARPRDFETESARESLIAESYRLNREIGYTGFRHQYFDDPNSIQEWPEPAVREAELRSFWDAQGDYEAYRGSFADVATDRLSEYRDSLADRLAADESVQVAYYDEVTGRGREAFRALAAETRADEHAARVRDFGPEDAATHEVRMEQGYRLRELEPGPMEPQPMSDAELGRVVTDVEASWATQAPVPRDNGADDYDRLLTLAAARRPANDNERGRDR